MRLIQNASDNSCAPYYIPSIPEYMKAVNTYGIILCATGACALFIVILIFADTLRYIIKHLPSDVKSHAAFVIAVYPVSCLVSFFAILVPRAHLLSEAITQGMFMSGMYQLFCLFVCYSGGVTELVASVQPNSLKTNVGPCCCWPCCIVSPPIEIKKKTVKFLRILVLQLPIIQGLVYLILLIMWAEAESLYQINYMYLQPIIILSILFGVWGMTMTIKLLQDTLGAKYSLIGKFFVLQMVLVFAKLQGLITRMLVWTDVLPCNPPITPQVYANLIHNLLMIMEMVLLGLIARKLYKKNIPEMENLSPNSILDKDQFNGKNNNEEDKSYDNFGCDVRE